MALLLYVCNSVSLVWITYRVQLPVEKMARGQQKIQSQQKAAEKAAKLKKAVRRWMIMCRVSFLNLSGVFLRGLVVKRVSISGWQLEAWQCQDCSGWSQVRLHHLQVRIFFLFLWKWTELTNHIAGLRCRTPRHTSSILKANTPNNRCQRNWKTSRHSLNFSSCFCQAMQQCDTHLMSCFGDILWRDMS